MDRLVSVLEAFFRPKDSYTTGSRTVAFLLAALVVILFEWQGKDMNPWVIALLVAGLLNGFALVFNLARTAKEKPFVELNEARELVWELAGGLEIWSSVNRASENKGDVVVSMARASAALDRLGVSHPTGMTEDNWWGDWHRQVPGIIRVLDSRVSKLKSRSGFWKRSYELFIGQSV